MTRTKVLLLVCFVAAFAAGTTTGLVVRHSEPARPRPRPLDELKLTEAQRAQMHQIWSPMDANGREDQWDKRRRLSEERDKAVAALFTPEQKAQFDQIQQDYQKKSEELSQERKRAFDAAVERTKKEVLTPEQAKKYDEILSRGPGGQRGPGGPRGRGEGPGLGPPPGDGGFGPMWGRRGGSRSRPATQESNALRVGE